MPKGLLISILVALGALLFCPQEVSARESARAGYSIDAPPGWTRDASVPPRVIRFVHGAGTPQTGLSIALIGADVTSIALFRGLMGDPPSAHVERLANGAVLRWEALSVPASQTHPLGGTEYDGEIILRSALFRIGGTIPGPRRDDAYMVSAMRSIAASLQIDVPIERLPQMR